MKELILLVEPDGLSIKLRPWQLARPFINEIIERSRISSDHVWERRWRCTNGERALSGQRIFREVVPPVEEEKENPIYQELELKKPIPLTPAEARKMNS